MPERPKLAIDNGGAEGRGGEAGVVRAGNGGGCGAGLSGGNGGAALPNSDGWAESGGRPPAFLFFFGLASPLTQSVYAAEGRA